MSEHAGNPIAGVHLVVGNGGVGSAEELMPPSIGAWRDIMPDPIGITERTRRHRPRARRLLAAALGCLLLAGCASPSTPAPAPTASNPAPTTPATYSPQLCSAAADYQKAANAVVHLDANKVGNRRCQSGPAGPADRRAEPDHGRQGTVRSTGRGAGEGHRIPAGHPGRAQRSGQPLDQPRQDRRLGRRRGAGRQADRGQCPNGLSRGAPSGNTARILSRPWGV